MTENEVKLAQLVCDVIQEYLRLSARTIEPVNHEKFETWRTIVEGTTGHKLKVHYSRNEIGMIYDILVYLS